jgi:hypothetical protein
LWQRFRSVVVLFIVVLDRLLVSFFVIVLSVCVVIGVCVLVILLVVVVSGEWRWLLSLRVQALLGKNGAKLVGCEARIGGWWNKSGHLSRDEWKQWCRRKYDKGIAEHQGFDV